MSVTSFLIEFNGQYAGHALSLGTQYVFHSGRKDLAELDGTSFASLADLRAAVNAALEEPVDMSRAA